MANTIDKANTPGEIVDLVDRNDHLIGTISKKEVNSNPKLFHREIGVILHAQDGKILYQQRSHQKSVHPLYWSISVEGHIPAGLDPEFGAHRELKEELGIDTKLKFLFKRQINLPNETYFGYYYEAIYNGEKIKIEPEEIEQIQFMHKEDLQTLIKNGGLVHAETQKILDHFWRTL